MRIKILIELYDDWQLIDRVSFRLPETQFQSMDLKWVESRAPKTLIYHAEEHIKRTSPYRDKVFIRESFESIYPIPCHHADGSRSYNYQATFKYQVASSILWQCIANIA